MLYFGVIEAKNNDMLMLARYKVRVVGVHSPLQSDIETNDLPWATAVQSNSAAMSGIGVSPTGYLPGSTVVVMFADNDKQIPMILGAIAGIASGAEITGLEMFAGMMSETELTPPQTPPEPVNNEEQPYVGKLTAPDIRKLIPLIPELKNSTKYAETDIGIGVYQFSYQDMERLGYTDNNFKWKGLNGITSAKQFLDNDGLQYDAQENLFKLNYTELIKASICSVNTPKEKLAGCLVATQVSGIPGTYDLVHYGENTSNTAKESCLDFYFAGYRKITGKSTTNAPTKENIDLESTDKFEQATTPSKSKFDVKPIEKLDLRQGFRDPENRFPRKSHLHESDVNRLARGVKVSETCVGVKEAFLTKNVKIANSTKTWNQSPVPYCAVYPHNNVFESTSGHVMEFDDTPGCERIHTYHKSGTFNEIDNAGNSVDKTVGIRTIIVEKDELVYIKGSGHVTIDGDMSIKVSKALNVEITGDANFKVDGNVNYEVKGNFNINATGAISMDGAGLNMNAGVAVVPLKEYAPDIVLPAPVTRREIHAIELENEDGNADVSHLPPPKVSLIDEDKPTMTYTHFKSEYELPDNISKSTQLTANFNVGHLCVGDIGAKYDPSKGQHGLTAKQIATNLQNLSLNCLEPMKEYFSTVGFKINSGVRPAGNPLSEGRKTISQHEFGEAADISFSGIRGKSNDRELFLEAAKWIRDNIPFNQLILEYRDAGKQVWIHISYKASGNKGQVLTMNNDKTVAQGLCLVTV